MDERWRLLPVFLKSQGLVKQHIASFNYFVLKEMREIVRTDSNRYLTSTKDQNFKIEYINCTVAPPTQRESGNTRISPHMCRLSDRTYSGDIVVQILITFRNTPPQRHQVVIGQMPVMLRSCRCHLHNATEEQQIALHECPLDPGGYFVIRGTEKVMLMQEQMSSNRIIVEKDPKGLIHAVITCTSTDNKSRTALCQKPCTQKRTQGALYLKHSAFIDVVPVVIVFKAMGIDTDIEIMQNIGSSTTLMTAMGASFEDSYNENVRTKEEAEAWLFKKLKKIVEYKPPHDISNISISERNILTSEHNNELLHQVLRKQVLSHIDAPDRNYGNKIRAVAQMCNRVILAQENPKKYITCRDYWGNKRLELAGHLISLLFEDLFKTYNSNIRNKLDIMLEKYNAELIKSRNPDLVPVPDIPSIMRSDQTITKGLHSALSSGNLKIKRFNVDKTGVSQILTRLSFIGAVGSMTKIKASVITRSALPRGLQPSQWGVLCPSDTPEGEQCGIVKNLALFAHVTTNSDPAPIEAACYMLGVAPTETLCTEELINDELTQVYLNGQLLGVHMWPQMFLQQFRYLRRKGLLAEFVSAYSDEVQNCVLLSSDGGRLCRPVIIVNNGIPNFIPERDVPLLYRNDTEFKSFVKSGVVEWLDVNEENDALIAVYPDQVQKEHTHMEIEPFTLLGIVAGLIPYPHHNQSPRNTYQCAMGKQAMGAIAYNQFIRSDSLLLGLTYPQKPMVKTKTIELCGFEQLPAGHNCSVSVMSFSGYDIEDAIVMNTGSIDRGFGRCHSIKTVKVQMGGTGSYTLPDVIFGTSPGSYYDTSLAEDQKSVADDALKLPKNAQYSALLKPGGGENAIVDGLPQVRALVNPGDVIINRFTPTSRDGIVATAYKPRPELYKVITPARVDRVLRITDQDNSNTVKVMFRQIRKPELGDKFSSRHGQKGVVGYLCPPVDLPINELGQNPDLIMNPHGFPSRMTVGKMIECIASKAGANKGNFAYGTIFGGAGGTKTHQVYKDLIAQGLEPHGKDLLISGITGEALECYVFMGLIYYQKLKHMVEDKIHARSRGPITSVTRQPMAGRSKQGGLRIGEMERDCFIAYGASNVLLERLMISSDLFHATVCSTCGLISRRLFCKNCSRSSGMVDVKLPYACKVLFQELQSMNIIPRLVMKT